MKKDLDFLVRVASGEFVPDDDAPINRTITEELTARMHSKSSESDGMGMKSLLAIDIMMPYADLMTLLLVFFIFFFTISTFEQKKTIIKQHEVIVERARLDSLRMRNEQVFTIPGEVLFESGHAEIKEESFLELQNIANTILHKTEGGDEWMIRVEGHTDDIPINSKKYSSNWQLSTARAVSIVGYFIENGFFNPEQVQAMGYAEFKPLVANNNKANRQKNRRVEIRLTRRF